MSVNSIRARSTALVLLLPLALAACGKPPPAGPMELPPAPVSAQPAITKDVLVYLDEIGRCVASETVVVMPRVTGSVATVLVKDGATVAPDAPLFTIDARPYEAKLTEARAEHAAAEAAVAQAKAGRASASAHVGTAKSKRDQARAQVAVAQALTEATQGDATAAESDAARASADRDRMEAVGGSGAISQQDLTRMRTDLSSAEAKLAAARRRVLAAQAHALEVTAGQASAEQEILEAEAQLVEADARIASAEAAVQQQAAAVATAQLDVDFCKVAAPIAGHAGRRMVDVGSVVTANGTPMLSIQRVDPIHVEFSVTERDLTLVQRQMGKRTLRAEVRLPDGEEPREGDVTFLDNAVEPGTGTVRMRVTVANADARFWPGRFARVRLLVDALPGAVLVPAAAPQVSAIGTVVFVVVNEVTVKDPTDPTKSHVEGVVEMRPVQLGQRHGDMVVVQGPVKAGDPVIVDRHMYVFPGSKVVPLPVVHAPPAGAPGAAPPALEPTTGSKGSSR